MNLSICRWFAKFEWIWRQNKAKSKCHGFCHGLKQTMSAHIFLNTSPIELKFHRQACFHMRIRVMVSVHVFKVRKYELQCKSRVSWFVSRFSQTVMYQKQPEINQNRQNVSRFQSWTCQDRDTVRDAHLKSEN